MAKDPTSSHHILFKGDQKNKHFKIKLQKILSGLNSPVDVHIVPGQTNKLIVLEQNGQIKLCQIPLGKCQDIFKIAVKNGSELGLLSLAFHPRFSQNKKFYINYNPAEGKRKTRISEWRLHLDDKEKIKSLEERVILEIEQPYTNHNGGALAFGLDHFLYIGMGDGGSAGDPNNYAQNLKSLLGKILRIDVDKKEGHLFYEIPPDNPFIKNENVKKEIFAYGLRNPWRFAFTDKNELIVADVGQDQFEEVSLVEKGKNYGWNVVEGNQCFKKDKCQLNLYTHPLFVYSHKEGQSITGGHIYRGKKIPQLQNKFVFGDYVSGKIWALDISNKNVVSLGKWSINISTFGIAEDGEIMVVDYEKGALYQILPY